MHGEPVSLCWSEKSSMGPVTVIRIKVHREQRLHTPTAGLHKGKETLSWVVKLGLKKKKKKKKKKINVFLGFPTAACMSGQGMLVIIMLRPRLTPRERRRGFTASLEFSQLGESGTLPVSQFLRRAASRPWTLHSHPH